MKNAIRQLLSFSLPFTALILFPLFIEPDISIKNVFAFAIGLAIIVAGLFVMVLMISAFIRIGKGTLAPWSPTKKLVVYGIYRHVRNPMIMSVMTVLLGEALAILSLNILVWALAFFAINHLWFLVFEEPDLEDRFGNEYRQYKAAVPRWIPKWKGYDPHLESAKGSRV
jgi:protein-S-isoprenylcysteine O-methyltransferase Ste14